MAVPALLLDACVAFAATVSPEAVSRITDYLEGGDTVHASSALSGDAALSYEALLSAWTTSGEGAPARDVAFALRGAARALAIERSRQRVELVWSGPSTPSSTLRSTAPALLELIRGARESVYLVTFAAYRVPAVAEALTAAIRRGVRVVVVLESDSANGGKVDFDPLPHLIEAGEGSAEVYVWPAELRQRDSRGHRGTLHAKFAVADRRQLLVSSANLTEFAFNLNIELGVMLTGGIAPAEAAGQIDHMIRLGTFRPLRNAR